jgi:hypothetical protein
VVEAVDRIRSVVLTEAGLVVLAFVAEQRPERVKPDPVADQPVPVVVATSWRRCPNTVRNGSAMFWPLLAKSVFEVQKLAAVLALEQRHAFRLRLRSQAF